ncbi:MAG: hypothetical protein K2N63_14990 [Lachnospiraceae bacterium]|nr:hypothetical protein [Lachnospiraceae bacterium]
MRNPKLVIKILTGLCICVLFKACGMPKTGDKIYNTIEIIDDIYKDKMMPGLEAYKTKLKTEVIQNNNIKEEEGSENVSNPTKNSPNQKTGCHAFLLEENTVFIADLPVDWRCVMKPVYDFAYCTEFLGTAGEDDLIKRCVDFIGIGGEDSEDNFFVLTVGTGERKLRNNYVKKSVPFVFQDGTLGEWVDQTWEETLHYKDITVPQYEGIVQDTEKKYYIHLGMLKEEYDANREIITDFLQSVCFRESDLGVSDEPNVLERELITLHLWNEYLNLSLRVPEGVGLKEKRFYNANDYLAYECKIDLSQDGKEYICIYSDPRGGILERTGDYQYYLNTQDFDGTVYEIPDRRGFYFPNRHLMIWTNLDDKNDELWEYTKGIVQSIRFE